MGLKIEMFKNDCFLCDFVIGNEKLVLWKKEILNIAFYFVDDVLEKCEKVKSELEKIEDKFEMKDFVVGENREWGIFGYKEGEKLWVQVIENEENSSLSVYDRFGLFDDDDDDSFYFSMEVVDYR